MIAERPVIGKGWGCFELFYPFYQGRHLFLNVYRNFRTHANNTHNEILEIWSQTGTVGFGIYLWFLVTVFASGLYLIKNLQGQKRFLAIGLTASITGMLADNMLNVSLHFATPAFLYWWNIGLLISLFNLKDMSISLKSILSRVIVFIIIISGCIVIIRYTKNFLGEMHYFNGFKLKQSSLQEAIVELETAHRFQRFEVNNNYELANAYARTNDRDKAIETYKEALRANAGYDEIYFNLATILSQNGKIKDAAPEYTRSLYLNPTSLESYAALGSIFLQTPDFYSKAGCLLFKQAVFFFPEIRICGIIWVSFTQN